MVALLGRGDAPQPEVTQAHVAELSAELGELLAPIEARLDRGNPLWVSKHTVASVHGCETGHVAEEAHGFRWSPPLLRGTVVHKAIEFMVNWPPDRIVPADLVDEAMNRLIGEPSGRGEYTRTLTQFEIADVRAVALETVTKFTEVFPPLKPQWRPVTESTSRVEMFGGALILAGKTDLTLGSPGSKVVLDLKTGSAQSTHRDDLRFYALLEALRLGVAPRKLGSVYLDTARCAPEDVSVDVLRSAVLRTADAVKRLVELRDGDKSSLQPGPRCRWCPLLDTCATGRAHLTQDEEPEAVVDPLLVLA